MRAIARDAITGGVMLPRLYAARTSARARGDMFIPNDVRRTSRGGLGVGE